MTFNDPFVMEVRHEFSLRHHGISLETMMLLHDGLSVVDEQCDLLGAVPGSRLAVMAVISAKHLDFTVVDQHCRQERMQSSFVHFGIAQVSARGHNVGTRHYMLD